MLKAIIFDFNGVILDDEPLHFEAMREAVLDFDIVLTREEYWSKYLPFDDTECLDAILRDKSVQPAESRRTSVLEKKAKVYQRLLRGGLPLFPGAAKFIEAAAALYPLALASGARRNEIESTLNATGLMRHFSVIVAAEDFIHGKPNPESFLLALERLNSVLNRRAILPNECLVIEDSAGGVIGARAAGMACLAITNSYPPEALVAANKVVASFEEIQPDGLAALLEGPP
jgi:HAD superfamily hydrolase (TIGR01509 family)